MFAPSLWFHLYKDRKAALASASAKAKAKAVPAPVWYWASFSFMVDVYCTFPWQFHGFSNTSLMCMHSGSGPPRHRRGSSRPGVLVSSCINQWMCVLCYIPLYLCLLCCRVAGLSILHDRRVIKWFVFSWLYSCGLVPDLYRGWQPGLPHAAPKEHAGASAPAGVPNPLQ